jgi:hypothetical protein
LLSLADTGGRRHVTADTGRLPVTRRHLSKLTARCRSSSASPCQKKRGSLVRPANRTKGGQPFQVAAVFPLYTTRIFGIFGSI